jgi:RimJ/RimL family protein N-acetyltransferase
MILPILFTRNLILRPANGEDFEAWAAFHADEETMRFLGGTQVRAIAWRGLCALAGAWTVRGYAMFSVIERESGRWAGGVGPWRPRRLAAPRNRLGHEARVRRPWLRPRSRARSDRLCGGLAWLERHRPSSRPR